MTARIALLACALAIAACRAPDVAPRPNPAAKAAEPRLPSRALLDDLALITTGHSAGDDNLQRWLHGLSAKTLSTDDVIDELLRDRSFLTRVTRVFLWNRELYLGIARYDRPHGWVLKHTPGDPPIYYARQACAPAVAQDVHPWWAMTTTVKVCPDSYRPAVLWMNAERACSAANASPDMDTTERCGCGPNLMRCTPDEDTFLEFRRQFVAEIEDTVADIVDRDEPIKNAYLTNETVRKPLVELQYDVWRAERGELKELPDVLASWPAAGERAPRYEDQLGDHAGILTAVGALWMVGGLRAWMQIVQQSMWCSAIDNSHVESTTLFEAAAGGNANLRGGEGWKRLANHPVCGSCHARMDYGWQFFIGYPDFRIATHYIPPKGAYAAKLQMIDNAEDGTDARTQLGTLYMTNFADYRGERQKRPLEYAKWAVEQPEFGTCQARRVVDQVFGPDATPEDREAIEQVYAKTERLRPMLREALRRYVQRKLVDSAGGAQPAPTFLASYPSATGMAPDTPIELLPETRAMLDEHCLECHSSTNPDPTKNFEVPALSRERMTLMLEHVADRRMPKTTAGLTPDQRRKAMTVLISNLWADDADRRAVFDYYDERLASTPVQRPEAVLSLIYERAGAEPEDPVSPMVELTIASPQLEFTPGLAAHVALEAVRACEAAHADDLSACVERAASLDGIVRE